MLCKVCKTKMVKENENTFKCPKCGKQFKFVPKQKVEEEKPVQPVISQDAEQKQRTHTIKKIKPKPIVKNEKGVSSKLVVQHELDKLDIKEDIVYDANGNVIHTKPEKKEVKISNETEKKSQKESLPLIQEKKPEDSKKREKLPPRLNNAKNNLRRAPQNKTTNGVVKQNPSVVNKKPIQTNTVEEEIKVENQNSVEQVQQMPVPRKMGTPKPRPKPRPQVVQNQIQEEQMLVNQNSDEMYYQNQDGNYFDQPYQNDMNQNFYNEEIYGIQNDQQFMGDENFYQENYNDQLDWTNEQTISEDTSQNHLNQEISNKIEQEDKPVYSEDEIKLMKISNARKRLKRQQKLEKQHLKEQKKQEKINRKQEKIDKRNQKKYAVYSGFRVFTFILLIAVCGAMLYSVLKFDIIHFVSKNENVSISLLNLFEITFQGKSVMAVLDSFSGQIFINYELLFICLAITYIIMIMIIIGLLIDIIFKFMFESYCSKANKFFASINLFGAFILSIAFIIMFLLLNSSAMVSQFTISNIFILFIGSIFLKKFVKELNKQK